MLGMSSTATAVIINGILCKFVKAGNLGENRKHFLCDSKKAFRAKESAVKYFRTEGSCSLLPKTVTLLAFSVFQGRRTF